MLASCSYVAYVVKTILMHFHARARCPVCLPVCSSLPSIFDACIKFVLGCRHREHGAHSYRTVRRPDVRALRTADWGCCHSRGGGQSTRYSRSPALLGYSGMVITGSA